MADSDRKAQEKTENAIREAYITAIETIVGDATISEIEKVVGDLDEIVEQLKIKSGQLDDLQEAVREAYKKGGKREAKRAKISFDMRNEAAEEWLREHSSELVTRINEQQRKAIREAVESGMRQGLNPRRTALDIVGRKSGNNKRKGGIVGLTEGQASAVTRAREQLRSGDPTAMRQYLQKTRRDKRFDKRVQKAIEQGKPLDQDSVDKIVSRYSDSLLKTRGNNIARTESMQAFHQARKRAWEQAIEDGEVDESEIKKRWDTAIDERTRSSHAEIDGKTIPVNEMFDMPQGGRMDHPGDSEHGAGPEEVINCRCTLSYTVDYTS